MTTALMTREFEPLVSMTLFRATEDVSAFFAEADDCQLPEFQGSSYDEHVIVWMALARKDKWTSFRKAAIAASLVRHTGQRDGAETQIQAFCRTSGIGAGHLSRLAKTHGVLSGLLATGSKVSLPSLLADDRLAFKHYLIAATMATLPVEALIEASANRWSANELARVLAERKGRVIVDAQALPLSAEDDTDDADAVAQLCDVVPTTGAPRYRPVVEHAPAKAQIPGTRLVRIELRLDTAQFAEFTRQLKDVRRALHLTTTAAVVRAAIATAADALALTSTSAAQAEKTAQPGGRDGDSEHERDQATRREGYQTQVAQFASDKV